MCVNINNMIYEQDILLIADSKKMLHSVLNVAQVVKVKKMWRRLDVLPVYQRKYIVRDKGSKKSTYCLMLGAHLPTDADEPV